MVANTELHRHCCKEPISGAGIHQVAGAQGAQEQWSHARYRSCEHTGRATTAPAPPALLRAFSQEPVGPTRHMVVRPLSILGNTRLDFARTCGHTF